MACVYYNNNDLYIEKVSLKDGAERFGTPCYLYSKQALISNWQEFDIAFNNIHHLICYSVKANSNLAVLQVLAQQGSGFDIVSLGELERVLAAHGEPEKVIFSGVGKKSEEISRCIEAGIYCFDVESIEELQRLQDIAHNKGKNVNVALRINPNVDARTHAHIATGLKENKFGIASEEVSQVAEMLKEMASLQLIGLACHIGSQLLELQPFLKALDELLTHYKELKAQGFNLRHLNIGGGLGIKYHNENPPTVREYALALEKKLKPYDLKLIIEPGRAIVGNAGVLLTKIEYLKHSHKNFAVVDAGMNDFVRPALYDAWHEILPVHNYAGDGKQYDIVGPVCESSDYLGKNRELVLQAGDLLVVQNTGAYGFSMSSNYNSRCRPAEVLVDGEHMHLIRRRETISDLMQFESLV